MNNIEDFKGKKVVVMGLGLHGGGAGAVKWLVEQGANVLVTDLKSEKELAPSVKSLFDLPITYVLGEHRQADFEEADLIVPSPGVPPESKYLQLAKKKGVAIESAASLFLHLAKENNITVIGVTGTKGKTTTATLLSQMLKNKYKHSELVGTPQNSPFKHLKAILRYKDPVVFELSSWQLESLEEGEISPQIAIITNLYPDHLNRHKTMDNYRQAKENILKFQSSKDLAILNKDQAVSEKFKKQSKGKVKFFSSGIKLTNKNLLGEHNQSNTAAASIAAKELGVEENSIVEAINDFKGVPGRMELVRTVQGVEYYNDTTATIPDAVITSLNALSDNHNIILIAGGSDKGMSYEALVKLISTACSFLILLPGDASDQIYDLTPESFKEKVFKVESMEQAVHQAASLAKKEDRVLLSPAAASFASFIHEFARGDAFAKEVKKLK